MGDIEQREDGFYFWDECGLYDIGPFDTIEEAIEEQDEYFRLLEGN